MFFTDCKFWVNILVFTLTHFLKEKKVTKILFVVVWYVVMVMKYIALALKEILEHHGQKPIFQDS